jgi:hypothetical protein
MSISRIPLSALLDAVMRFEPGIYSDDSQRTFTLSLHIVKHFLKGEWMRDHMVPDGGKRGFLSQAFGTPVEGEIQSYRVVDLAELLFNLQHIAGFDQCVERLRQGAVEATHAELDFGRMLHEAAVKFRFVKPQGIKGSDYDIEITLPDGVTVCADAKCKIEATEFSEGTVRNSLGEARKQFPPDRPSAIFVKVPSRWLSQHKKGDELIEIAKKFLAGTGRIVSVKFYTCGISYAGGFINRLQSVKEISNPKNRFDPKRDWNLFGAGADTVQKQWLSLTYFPKRPPSYVEWPQTLNA